MEKKNKILTAVIFIGLIILGLIGYIYYQNGLIGNKKSKSNNSETEENVTEKNIDNATSNQSKNNNTIIYRLSSCNKNGSVTDCNEIFGRETSKTNNNLELLERNQFKLYVGEALNESGNYKQEDSTLKFLTSNGAKMIGNIENNEVILKLTIGYFADQNIELIFVK